MKGVDLGCLLLLCVGSMSGAAKLRLVVVVVVVGISQDSRGSGGVVFRERELLGRVVVNLVMP